MELTPKTAELRPDELAIIESLPPVHSEFVRMRLEHKFESYSQKEQKIISLNVITLAYRYLNQDSRGTLDVQASDLFTCLSSKENRVLTISEIKKAFYNGLDGIYGPFFGLCAKTYNFFLKSFREDKNRSKAWSDFQDRLEVPKSDRVVFYTRERLTEMMKRDFADFKANGDTPNSTTVCGLYYDLLKELMGVKTLITGDWEEIKKEGISSYRNQRKGREKEIDKVVEMYGTSLYNNEIKKVALRRYWASVDSLTI